MQQTIQQTTQRNELSYGGFWRRFAAFWIDSILMTFFCGGAAVALALVTGVKFEEPAAGAALSPEMLKFTLGYYAITFAYTILYFCVMQAKLEGTFGKKLLGLRIVRMDYSQVGIGQLIGRWFAMIPSYMVFGFGFIAAGFHDRKQSWHDRIAKTYVIHADSLEQARSAPRPVSALPVAPPRIRKAA